jgi:hypothetical protein
MHLLGGPWFPHLCPIVSRHVQYTPPAGCRCFSYYLRYRLLELWVRLSNILLLLCSIRILVILHIIVIVGSRR